MKLYDFGIDGKSWGAICSLYSNLERRVINAGNKSDWFPIKQGTTQGSVLSPLFYIIYINDLLVQLQRSSCGFVLHELNVCSPTVADDIVILSFSKSGLDEMLDISYR